MARLREMVERQRDRLVGAWSHWFGNPRAATERPLPAADLTALMEQASHPSFAFYFMLGLATAIATLGLLANSAATIIGAMIIAPLMAPIISLAYGLVVVDWLLIGRSIVAVVTGVLLVIGLAYASTELAGLGHPGHRRSAADPQGVGARRGQGARALGADGAGGDR